MYATYYPGDRKIKICLALPSGSPIFVGLFDATKKMHTRDIRRMCSMKVYKKLNRSRLNAISLVGSNSHEPFNPRGVFYDPMQTPCDVEAFSKRLKTLVLCFGVVFFELIYFHLVPAVVWLRHSPYLIQYLHTQ